MKFTLKIDGEGIFKSADFCDLSAGELIVINSALVRYYEDENANEKDKQMAAYIGGKIMQGAQNPQCAETE